MRIAMFSESYRPYVSGVVASLETLTGELRHLGHELVVFAPRYPGWPGEPGVVHYPSIPAPGQPEFRLAIPIGKSIAGAFGGEKPDVIHVHSPFAMGLAGARWARRLRIPLVFTYHTLYTEYLHYVPLKIPSVRRLTERYLTYFCNSCHAVVAPSRAVHELLVAGYGVKAPVHVMPTGVNAPGVAYEQTWLRNRLSIPTGATVLLYVGRLGLEKNVAFILRSFQRLVHGRASDCRLVVVGGGTEERNLAVLARRLGIDGRVVFTGRWPREDVQMAYAGSDLFVFASRTETQGLVILEAMAGGLPVVALKASGVEDVVEDGVNGLMCGSDEEEFARLAGSLVDDPSLRRSLAAEALLTAEDFSAARQADRMAALYGTLIGKGKPLRT